jgi:hypothetical protein
MNEARAARGSRAALAVLMTVFLSVVIVGRAAPARADTGAFEQDQRTNSLTLERGTDTFAPNNAFGGAFSLTALGSLQLSIDSLVTDGTISLLLEMPDLIDLSGTDNGPFGLGVVNGWPYLPPGNPTIYDGANDTDWWYGGAPTEVNPDGGGVHQLPASFTSGTLTAGPGTVELDNVFPLASLVMSSARIEAQATSSSPPLQSTNGFPPGHLAEEGLSPDLTSFSGMTGGRLAGNISAASLEASLIVPGLVGSSCNQLYTIANTMLDVLVAGCSYLGLLTLIQATQPDTALTPGDVYVFQTDAVTKHVNACTKNAVPAVLTDCLNAAGYSAYFKFTTDRVIVRKPCAPGSYSDSGVTPCTLADPGFFTSGYGSTSQTACPAGTTSSPGAASCPLYLTFMTVECSKNPVPIGVATTCQGTVVDQIAGPAATGALGWSRPAGGGAFSAQGCTLTAAGDGGACSVTYTPASGSAGQQQLGAAYAGDDTHALSTGQLSLQVVRRATSTAVVCKPTTIEHGKSTFCVASVSDSAPGTKSAPTGTVRWSAESTYGVFSKTTCTLARRDGGRRCGVTFTTRRKVRGKISLTATYLGDANHRRSSRTAWLKVV